MFTKAMLKIGLFLLLLLSPVFCDAQKRGKIRTILFIGAHPDDETAISEVLSKYGRLGNKIYVIVATDGKEGTRVTNIPAGDSLGKLRRAESVCGCRTLGTEPPIFFGIERLDTRIGTGRYFKEHQRFMDSLKARIPQLNPDFIITAGPDGDTHHSEHIVVGATVTELLLAEGWVEKYPLYHFAWKKGDISIDPGGYVDARYYNVSIDYLPEDEARAIMALKCYVTQYTPEEMREETERKTTNPDNSIHFRRFVVKKGWQNDF
jgi:LmbE family N-acetylglucosaminyl deacetylase